MEDIPEFRLKRIYHGYKHKVKVKSPHSAVRLFKTVGGDYVGHKEIAIAIYFDRDNNSIGHQIIGLGDASSCIIDIQQIVKTAIMSGAQSIILSHCHPSGNLKASDNDRKITRKLEKALSYFSIKLLDHLIFRDEDYSYYSFQEESEL